MSFTSVSAIVMNEYHEVKSVPIFSKTIELCVIVACYEINLPAISTMMSLLTIRSLHDEGMPFFSIIRAAQLP
jgi:hypothetical protein